MKTATVKNGKIKLGDKVIFVPHDNFDRAFYGNVTAIYRYGNSPTYLDIQTKNRLYKQVCAVFLYKGTN